MNDVSRPALGLSVGASNVAAVTANNAVRRNAVMTLFAHRPPAVGSPGDNPEQGLVIKDFVDRVGDPVAMLASDGSNHRSETVLAQALRALAYTATAGRPLPDVAAVTYPAHWRPAAVDALRRALARMPEWSHEPVTLLSDVTAALTALQHDPGLPARGVIAVCDFGGSGTSITLVDAADGYRPIGPTVRHVDFSGDLVDQALLTHVIGDLAGAGSVDLASTSAIGSLARLRDACRAAKERLSAGISTALPVELPGYRGDVRLTRTELDQAVRGPLADVVDVLRDTLRRSGIRASDLAAVATVGGGASIAAVTTTLSEQLRVPVITTPRPGLSAAIGAALRALRGPADDSATALAPAALAIRPVEQFDDYPQPDRAHAALAWSQADGVPDLERFAKTPSAPGPGSLTAARPQLAFEADPSVMVAEKAVPFYRRPLAVMVGSIVVILGAIGGIGVVLTHDSNAAPSGAPTPSINAPSDPPAPVMAAQPPAPAPAAEVPAVPLRTVTAVPAPVTRTQVVEPAAPAPQTVTAPAPPPVTETAPPPAPETVTETVAPSTAPASEPPAPPAPASQPPAPSAPTGETQAPPAPPTDPPPRPRWLSAIPPIPTIPGLPPFLPQPASP